jgi:3',5'-cyclic-AMP phosphodiesterase
MRIIDWSPNPIHEIAYGVAEPRGGIGMASLTVTRATVDRLPESLDAIVVASDLQGREWPPAHPGAPTRLFGNLLR